MPGIQVGRVKKDGCAAPEALQVGIPQQVLPKSHVPAVDVGFSCGQLEQELHCPWAVIGIHERYLYSCSYSRGDALRLELHTAISHQC